MRLLLGLLVLTAGLGLAVGGETGWRTDGTGRYPDAEPPIEFSPEKGVVWATAMPSWSNASPVVIEDRIFVCAEPDLLIAVSKESGEILWQAANPVSETSNAADQAGAPKPKTHKDNGFTSATPVSDGKHVFAVFGNGVVSAFDIEGKRLWSRFLEQPAHPWGHSTSPVLAGGLLLVHIETLVALDPSDGTEKWRQPAEKWESQKKKKWGTPVATRIGETDVVVTARGNVVRAADGEILHKELGQILCSSPMVADGIVYFFGNKGGRAVRLPKEIGGKPLVLWDTRTVKGEIYYASPLLHDGLLYLISQRGHFSVFMADNGEEIVREKHLLAATVKIKDAAYTSVTLGGGSLYFAGVNGDVVVVKPGRTYERLALNKVEDRLRSNPVFEGNRMYLRAPGHLYCFGK